MSSGRAASTSRHTDFRKVFSEVGEIVEIRESDFRFDHPEFRQVAAGVRILRAKGGAERIDLRQGAGVALHVELPGNCQPGLLTEKVLVVVRIPVEGIKGRNTKEFAGSFAIVGGDDRRVDPQETVPVKIAVNGLGDGVAHPGDGAECVGARAQMGDGTQVF